MGEPRFSRRTLFVSLGLVAATAAGVVTYVSTVSEPRQHQIATSDRVRNASAVKPTIRYERVYSASRRREVTLAFYLPTGVNTRGMPMSILLHGLRGNARNAPFGGIAEQMAAAVAKRSVPAFGFVAVDGGDNYWHENTPGDDPMGMLLDEVPRWLKDRGYGEPFAITGVSMGGFGALLYARRRVERGDPIAAAAIVSPGLLTTWPEMAKRRAFKSEAEWAELDPLRRPRATEPTSLGVWVGDRDKFIEGTRRFLRDAKTEVAVVRPGGHDDALYRSVTPDVIRYLAKYAKRAV